MTSARGNAKVHNNPFNRADQSIDVTYASFAVKAMGLKLRYNPVL
jgi:hypothetical protein